VEPVQLIEKDLLEQKERSLFNKGQESNDKNDWISYLHDNSYPKPPVNQSIAQQKLDELRAEIV
jgi:hypothetical protein